MLAVMTATKPAPTSGFPVVNQICAAIDDQAVRDYAPTDITAKIIVSSLAEENGFFDLWSPEERAVSAALRRLSCGPRAAHYGWRLYRRYRQSGDIAADAVSY